MKTELNETEMLKVIQQAVDAESAADVARRLKISRAYMSDIVNSRRKISSTVARSFGYQIEIIYKRVYKKENSNDQT